MSARSKGTIQSKYRLLPSVDALLTQPSIRLLAAEYGEKLVVDGIRTLLADARVKIADGDEPPTESAWSALLGSHLAELTEPQLRPVINATGVIIHTNLGRAPLSEAARKAIEQVTHGYNNLEYDLESGKRGSRYDHARSLLTEITGADDALVVNNCASAVFLALTALCQSKDVIVSRGQLVEIGGGFRIPDVLRQSGANLVEVGTTNRTHPRDFEAAATAQTGALMRIHSSNFRLTGFVTMPSLDELVRVARAASGQAGVAADQEGETTSRVSRPIVIDDLGSGTFLATEHYGLDPEPTVQASIASGADVVAFSGDKLLGGPQAGILVGGREYIATLRRHPLARALRVDKMTLAALEATLRSYTSAAAEREIPIWQMISASKAALAERVEQWRTLLSASGINAELWEGESAIGGGSLPGETLPTALLAVPLTQLSPDRAASELRKQNPPVVCRIQQDHLLFDPRTVMAGQEKPLFAAIQAVLQP